MKIIGHRGAKGLAPENTLAGFKTALDHKVDGIEFDVRVTSDHVPVLSHDPKIVLEDGKEFIIKNTTYKELRAMYFDLLTLEEVLRLLQNKTLLVIEIKPEVELAPIITCLRLRLHNGLKPDKCLVSSFDFEILEQVKTALPELPLAVLERVSITRAKLRAKKLGTKYITINQRRLRTDSVWTASKKGYKLSTYTINDIAKAKKWAEAGLYAAITDFPDQF